MKSYFFTFIIYFVCYSSFANPPIGSKISELIIEDFPFSGPNCHNTSLRVLNLFSYKRYIHEPEMKFFLSERCTEGPQEKYTLGIIWLNQKSPLHSFVNLVDGKVFTKNGTAKLSKRKDKRHLYPLPQISSFKKMYRIHKDATEKVCNIQNISPCEISIKYYTCSPYFSEIEEIEKFYTSITQDRNLFFKATNQLKLLEKIQNIDWTEPNCHIKKAALKSIALSINQANMASLGPIEREQTELLEDEILLISESATCP